MLLLADIIPISEIDLIPSNLLDPVGAPTLLIFNSLARILVLQRLLGDPERRLVESRPRGLKRGVCQLFDMISVIIHMR